MSTPVPPEAERLNGWKEIARHLGKGTRTVQRWEKLYGLLVHRIGGMAARSCSPSGTRSTGG